ncbi:hypothetical protein ID866_6929 [Astraeus odoratus]|nr:hypothetical protein ID866_6929 [Astraeus odoratus]
MIPSSQIPPPTEALSPDLAEILQQRTRATLVALIKQHKHTRYFSESPVFGTFHGTLENLEGGDHEVSDGVLFEIYRTTVPLTTYDSYEPFIAKFFESNCQESDVRDMFSLGLPHHIAVSSATSGSKPKCFARYQPPVFASPFQEGRNVFWPHSLHYRQVVFVQNESGDTVKRIPVNAGSNGNFRILVGLDVEKDEENITLKKSGSTSPIAVGFIKNHRSLLLMHTLFALADDTMTSILVIFSTRLVDMMQYMEEEWDSLVGCIETGVLPSWEGTEGVREHLQVHFHARPERAAQLRVIGKATQEPGWFARIWPNLSSVHTVFSGVFSAPVPKIRHYLGPTIQLRSTGFYSSEAHIGSAYDPSELNLFKILSHNYIEYLDVNKAEQASSVIPPWEVEVGERYEVIVTTYNGLWRYCQGDIIEVAGFDPNDGQPIVRYVERRNITRVAGAQLTEKHIADAIFAVQDVLGALRYLVEIEGEVHPEADEAPARLLNELCCLNEEFKVRVDIGRMKQPTIRVLRHGTFKEYRRWRVEAAKSDSGQVKIAPPVETLSPSLTEILQQRSKATLVGLIRKNRQTRYFSESPVFESFHNAFKNLRKDGDPDLPDDVLFEAYRSTVPLTTYDSYEPFITKFFEPNCQENDVQDMFAPGLPNYIAVTSSTSGAKAKHLAKYPVQIPPRPTSSEGGNVCWVFSLRYRQIIDVRNEAGDTVKRIHVSPSSSGAFRMFTGLDLEKDEQNIRLARSGSTSPLAVGFIQNYRSFLLTHALFALMDAEMGSFMVTFSTVFVDMIQHMEREWDTLIACIETGVLPNSLQGMDDVREYIQVHFHAKPERAAELRAIGKATEEPGWLAKIWPNLKVVNTIASGVFSALVPKIRQYLGPGIMLRSTGFFASEGHIGTVYDPSDLNLFKIVSYDFFEYLDVNKPEHASSLVSPWQVEVGARYELVLTTRNGMWRYRQGDVVEIAGFDPNDGMPVVRYVERRSGITWLAGVLLTEENITSAISATQEVLGVLGEFTVVNDDRNGNPSLGYLVEIDGELDPKADDAPARLLTELCRIDEEFKTSVDIGRMGKPTIRVLKQGTFREYRQWRVEVIKSGSGQVKVPVVMWDKTAMEWVTERVEKELGNENV